MALSFAKENITLDAANIAVNAVIAHAREIGLKMVAVIVDTGGHLIALQHDDGAFNSSVGVATDKAITAATFGVSTDALCGAIKANPVLLNGIAARPNTVLFGGGYPIKSGNIVIGGIGVSGGSEDEDRACALKALEVLNK